MDYDVSLPSSLKRHKAEFLQASPVIQVFAASYAPGKVPLDTLNGFDISYLVLLVDMLNSLISLMITQLIIYNLARNVSH